MIPFSFQKSFFFVLSVNDVLNFVAFSVVGENETRSESLLFEMSGQ
jgi:hypothetical protein